MFLKGDRLDLTKAAKRNAETLTSVHPPKRYFKKFENTCTFVNTGINVGENNFRCGESEFTQDWNIMVSVLWLHKQEH
jgi:hypothetical protein